MAALPDEQSALFMVLQLLAVRGLNATRGSQGIPPKIQAAARAFTDYDKADVDKLKRSTDLAGAFPKGAVLRLEPPNHQAQSIVVLWCRWDFSTDPATCAFNYGEYWATAPIEGSAAKDPAAKSVVAFMGYRYETPHAGDNHNFYHCQPCLNMGDRTEPVHEALKRSEKNPTWPMPAENALDLLLCVVVSLYGFDGFREFETSVLQSREAQRNGVLNDGIRRIKALARKI